jgi:hypothetical protein
MTGAPLIGSGIDRENEDAWWTLIADTCEKDMSFVTTTCVARRIDNHGGYVGFRA